MLLNYTVPADKGGRKLSTILKRELNISTSMLKKLKENSLVTVDGQPLFMNAFVAPGSEIAVNLPSEPEPEYPAERGSLSILYEDDLFLAVDKPQGMIVHPSRSRNTGTLTNFVAGYLGLSAHVVTRLDRDTRGVALFAKSAYARALLGSVELCKIYEGVVCGEPEAKSGDICLPIARFDPASMVRVVRDDGQRAVTLYEVVKSLDFLGERLSVVRFTLLTGRTHQIRVHCKAMGWPLLGDPLYFSPTSQVISDELGLAGQELTAKSLSFIHPRTGEKVKITSNFC